jgi:hypothetical protein
MDIDKASNKVRLQSFAVGKIPAPVQERWLTWRCTRRRPRRSRAAVGAGERRCWADNNRDRSKESRSVGAHLVIWRAASDTNIASEVLLWTTVSGQARLSG